MCFQLTHSDLWYRAYFNWLVFRENCLTVREWHLPPFVATARHYEVQLWEYFPKVMSTLSAVSLLGLRCRSELSKHTTTSSKGIASCLIFWVRRFAGRQLLVVREWPDRTAVILVVRIFQWFEIPIGLSLIWHSSKSQTIWLRSRCIVWSSQSATCFGHQTKGCHSCQTVPWSSTCYSNNCMLWSFLQKLQVCTSGFVFYTVFKKWTWVGQFAHVISRKSKKPPKWS